MTNNRVTPRMRKTRNAIVIVVLTVAMVAGALLMMWELPSMPKQYPDYSPELHGPTTTQWWGPWDGCTEH